MIDVLLPHYGDGRFFKLAVASVLAQTSVNWNLIIVDDKSPDPSAIMWIKEIDHPRIQFFENPTNLGINGNFQRCLDLATSAHVVFLGCDDVLLPNYIEVMSDAVSRRPSAAMCQPRVEVIGDSGRPIRTLTDRVKRMLMPGPGERILSGETLAVSLLHGAWTYFPAICWKREALLSHPFLKGYETALDLALIMDLLIDGESFLLLDDLAFQYRRHDQSASSISALDTERFQEEAKLFKALRRRFEDNGWSKAARASALHVTSRLHAAALMRKALACGEPGAAVRLAQHALLS